MALQVSDEIASAMWAAIEDAVGEGAVLEIWGKVGPGGPNLPADCAADDLTILGAQMFAQVALPAGWASSSGSVAWMGDILVASSGNAWYFRVKDAQGVCHMQGSISTLSAGWGDMLAHPFNSIGFPAIVLTVVHWKLSPAE
jgi:hypothetical protein